MTTATNIGLIAARRFTDVPAAIVTATQWLEYLNLTYNEINSASPLWPWLESAVISATAAGGVNQKVALQTDVWQVNWVYNTTDDWPLVPIEGRGAQYHQGLLRTSVGSSPTTYRLRGTDIELFPSSSASTNIVYEAIIFPAALVGTDIPVFGQQYDGLLVEGMLAKAYEDDGNDKWFQLHQGHFNDRLKQMLNNVLFARTESSVPIRDSFWD